MYGIVPATKISNSFRSNQDILNIQISNDEPIQLWFVLDIKTYFDTIYTTMK